MLTDFPPSLSAEAQAALERLGVTPMLRQAVVGIDAEGVTIERPDHGRERIPARTVVWAAGVDRLGAGRNLGGLTGSDVDRAGRAARGAGPVTPGPPRGAGARGHGPRARQGRPPVTLPGVAPVAMQQGRYAARVCATAWPVAEPPFRYHSKGNLATIGRGRAVADLRFVRLSGLVAWLAWLVVHIWYLIGFQNRLLAAHRWASSFVTHGRGARLIAGAPPRAEPAGLQ